MANEVKFKLAVDGARVVSQEIDGVNRSMGQISGAAGTAAKALTGMMGGFSAALTIGKLISVQREFDVLNSSLITVTGSSGAAAKEMAWIKTFAKETPFGLAQATEGFVKMKALGLDPSRAALTSYGNTASAMGKNLNQMIEAVADASTGEFERLKEFGIKSKKEGDNVALTFQGVTTTIGNNSKEITGYLEAIGNNQFAGAMAERAKTLDGAIAGLGDTWDELFRTINTNNAGGFIYDSVTVATKAIEDAITVLNAMSGAANTNARETGAMTTVQEGLAGVFETVAVLGANVKYVLVQIGNEIGGLAAQAALFVKGGAGAGIALEYFKTGRSETLDQMAAIRKAMVEDGVAARREVESTSAAILMAREHSKTAAEVNTQANARLARQSTDAAAAIVTAHTTVATASKAAAEAAKKAAAEAEKAYKAHYGLVMSQIQAMGRLTDARNKDYDSVNDYMAAESLRLVQTANASEEAVRTAQAEFNNHGKLQSEIAATTLARLQDQLVNKTAGSEAYDSLVRQISAQKQLIGILKNGEVRDASEQAAKDAKAEWDKYADQIGQSLTDQLMQGGKSAADYIRDLFRTMVLRPVIGAIASPISQGVSSMVQGAGSSMLGSIGGSAMMSGAGLASMGTAFGEGFMATLGGSSLSGGAAAGILGTGGAAGAGIMGTLGAAAPWLLAAYALAGGFNNTKSTAGTGEASTRFDATGNALGTTANAAWGGSTSTTSAVISQMATSYITAAKALGITAASSVFAYGSNTGKQGENPNFAISARVGGASYNSGETGLSDAAVSLAASRAVFAALQGSDLPAYLSQVFDSLTASSATQEQITAAIQYAGSLKTIREALLETRTPLQIVRENVALATAALSTSAATFKTDFVAAIDAGIGPDKLAAWQSLGMGLDQLAGAADEAARSTKDAQAGIMALVAGITDKVSGSIWDMQYGMKDNAGKYSMLDVQAATLNDKMMGSSDINVIAKMASDQIDLINKSWSLLDPTQQNSTYLQFEDKLNQIDTFVQSKGADASSLKAASDKATADTIAAAVEAALAKHLAAPAAALQAASEKAERPIVVESHVTVTAPERAEVSIDERPARFGFNR